MPHLASIVMYLATYNTFSDGDRVRSYSSRYIPGGIWYTRHRHQTHGRLNFCTEKFHEISTFSAMKNISQLQIRGSLSFSLAPGVQQGDFALILISILAIDIFYRFHGKVEAMPDHFPINNFDSNFISDF